ncbi:hypothetical protein [Aurantimonas manganoxydans]|nr:hypothetical protein [Aurantimonas manganoxydans]
MNLLRRDELARRHAPELLAQNGGPAIPTDREAGHSPKIVWTGVTYTLAYDLAVELFRYTQRKVEEHDANRVRAWLRDPSRSRMPGRWPDPEETTEAFESRRQRIRECLSGDEFAAAIEKQKEAARKRRAAANALAAFRRKARRLKRR